MAVQGKIADYARSEMPQTWDALAKAPTFGDVELQRKIDSVLTRMFGQPIDAAVQDALDNRVADYLGKLVALDLINPGIDYWGKQPLTIGATGRNETKGYADRSSTLAALRTYLVQQTRLMWPEVEALLPGRRTDTVANRPRVQEIDPATAHTPSPYDFEPAFAPTTRTPRNV